MPLYIKISTEIKDDDKLNNAGPAAAWLWLRGLAWSKERLTDGFVADGALRVLCCGLGKPDRLSARLVECGLWVQVPGGYTVGSDRWSRHQTTKEQVDAKREQWAERKRVQRGHGVGHARVSTVDIQNVSRPENREQRTEPENISPLPPAGAGGPDPGEASVGRVRETMPAIPAELDSPAFLAAWDDWLAYRRELRKAPYRRRGLAACWAGLIADFGNGDAAAAAIRHSMAKGWQGIFGAKSGPGPPSKSSDFTALVADAFAAPLPEKRR